MITPDFVANITADALKIAILIAAPMLGLGLLVGLAVSIFQAVTSIQEMTLTFIPKILAVMLAILVFAPWMMQTMISYTAKIIIDIPLYVR